MRKKHFYLAVTSGLAAAVAGCDDGYDYNYLAQQNTAICIDPRTQNRVDDSYCGPQYHHSNVWYYVGRGRSIPYYGDHVSGGSLTRPAGKVYSAPRFLSVTRSSAISRGGFGSSARSSGMHFSS